VDEGAPFESYLALSGSQKLTAAEIYNLRLHADLVVLSACRSGSGKVSADGLVGFTRAFLYAGAASVLAPLWDIPDEPTVRLVEEFYRQYRGGANKAQALRAAQLKLLAELRSGKFTVATPAGPMSLPEHPAIWAGFVIQGDE
jgi:CHAT domain-containing protein